MRPHNTPKLLSEAPEGSGPASSLLASAPTSATGPPSWGTGLYLAFSVGSHAGAFPEVPCVVESAVEKLKNCDKLS